jgi:hypothetical protein
MFVVRDVFRCKPGKSRQLAEIFKKGMSLMNDAEGFHNSRILIDLVAGYWTVVLEGEVESLDKFEKGMEAYGARPDIRQAMAGYMDLVDSGYREIFRVHA